jgi:transcriptional regulator with XRE-family HTH domain
MDFSIGFVRGNGTITPMNRMRNTSEQYLITQMRFIISGSRGVSRMNINERIRLLMDERSWTEYRMAKEAGLAQSTIANLFNRNTVPSVSTLEAICGGFGITLAQFFSEGNIVELTNEQKELFDRWVSLTGEQKRLLLELVKNMK